MPAYCHPRTPQDIPAQKPVLLLRRDEETGAWSYRRTNGQWTGHFLMASNAIGEAEERFGVLPGGFEVKFRERGE